MVNNQNESPHGINLINVIFFRGLRWNSWLLWTLRPRCRRPVRSQRGHHRDPPCWGKLFWYGLNIFSNLFCWLINPFFSNLNSNCSSVLDTQPSASNSKSFLNQKSNFFLTVGQNNFGNKIPLKKSSFFFLSFF